MSLLQFLRHCYMGNFPFHHAADCFCSTNNNATAHQRKRRRRKLVHKVHHHWSWFLRRLVQQMLLLPLLLLVLLSSPASAITLPVAMPPSHPKHFLTMSGQDFEAGQGSTSMVEAVTSNRVPVGLENQVVREDEVMYHFYKNGRLGANYRRKASTVFMVQLFNDLLRGLAPTRRQRNPGGSGGRGDTASAKDQNETEEEVPFTDTIRSFSAEVRYSKKKRATISFSIPLLPPNERLRSAEIRFLRKPTTRKRKKKMRIKLRIDVLRGGKKVEKVVLRERPAVQRDYFVFDVSRVLDSWINSYHGNISLKIRVPKKLEKTVLLSDASLKSTSLIALYLEDKEFLKNMYESYTTEEDSVNDNGDSSGGSGSDGADQSRSRAKRDSNSRGNGKRRRTRTRKTKRWYRAPKHEKCQMYDFEVDFDFIGWGQWIIHPKHFNARFCYGECPSPVDIKFKPTNHAMLQTLMRQKRPRLAPPACCVPIRLKPLSMLYFEYDEIVVRHHENMIADECGCR
ncbi:nodal homolog [Littorina saxatilis]|uniref:TGF-beta family profile domain-containing protein n=1 Tax=Littorina saxatilis TaxID=31220 RepID=A0AAN9BX37_9CAEN